MEDWKFKKDDDLAVLISGQGNKISEKNLELLKAVIAHISADESVKIEVYHFEVY